MVRPSSLAFFQGGPAFLFPAPDGRLVPLAGPFQRLLPAPAILFEDASHLGRVVLDPEVASDDLGHPGLGPDVATKANGPWASNSSSCSRCWWANLGWRAGGLQWRRAWGPWALAQLSHWLTAPLRTPRASAMRCCGQPSWNSSQARRRRPSRQLVACWEYTAVIHPSMPAIHLDV
jgi:hypothetical protein